MADNDIKTCPKDCTMCSQAQRILCASQWSMMAMERIGEMLDRLEHIEDRLKETNHNKVFNPAVDTEESVEV